MIKLKGLWMVLATVGIAAPPGQGLAVSIQNYDLSMVFSRCTIEGVRDCVATDPVNTDVAYHGAFTIDAAALQTDGYKDVGFLSFYLALGGFIWDSLAPAPDSDYAGSRFYNPETRSGGFGPWTLRVENGELAGICCGVYGSADVPFVDLYSFGPLVTEPNRVGVFAAGAGRIPFAAQGRFSFRPVSEPGAVSLIAVGLVLLAVAQLIRRRGSAGASRPVPR